MTEEIQNKIDQLEIMMKCAVNKHDVEKEVEFWKGVLKGLEMSEVTDEL